MAIIGNIPYFQTNPHSWKHGLSWVPGAQPKGITIQEGSNRMPLSSSQARIGIGQTRSFSSRKTRNTPKNVESLILWSAVSLRYRWFYFGMGWCCLFFPAGWIHFLCHGPRRLRAVSMFFFLQFCRLTVPAQDFQDNGQIASLRCALRSLAEVSRYQSWNSRTIKSETTKELLMKNQMNTINNMYII